MNKAGPIYKKSLAPDLYEKVLAGAAILLSLLVSAALLRGRSVWNDMPPLIWAHLGTVMLPLALTPVQLLRRRASAAGLCLGGLSVRDGGDEFRYSRHQR